MVRDPWTFAAALALGFIAWFVFTSPQKSPPRLEAPQSLTVDPDLRLISERSEYMRTERY
jgi:hypothetical protein